MIEIDLPNYDLSHHRFNALVEDAMFGLSVRLFEFLLFSLLQTDAMKVLLSVTSVGSQGPKTSFQAVCHHAFHKSHI